jgi:RNA-directed DNA polymerase
MPRTYRLLYNKVYAFDNLHAAYLKARRGKRYRPEVLGFSAHLEERLLQLQLELANGSYHTGEYRRFEVTEPKRRLVAALPFRDRVVQHALCNIIEPIFEARFIEDSYACRVGKGTHAGADRLTAFLRKAQRANGETWILKGDIAKYFPSIDHELLMSIIGRTIRCQATMRLVREIVHSWHTDGRAGKGIAIGNLTSQLFANIYLNELDQFVKHGLRQRYYIRYMDDFVIVGADKGALHSVRQDIADFLIDSLALELNTKTQIFPLAHGVDFLGYRIWPTHRLLRKSSIRRMRRKLKHFAKLYATGSMDLEDIDKSVQSWLGHSSHANTYNLRKHIFGECILQRTPALLELATEE